MPARIVSPPELASVLFRLGHQASYAVARQYPPSSTFRGQNQPRLPDFISERWTGQRGGVELELVAARATWAAGGCAPIAFKRSTIARRSPARPSPSMVIGKPSSVAVMVNLAAGAGCFDSMGVTLEVFIIAPRIGNVTRSLKDQCHRVQFRLAVPCAFPYSWLPLCVARPGVWRPKPEPLPLCCAVPFSGLPFGVAVKPCRFALPFSLISQRARHQLTGELLQIATKIARKKCSYL